MGAIGRTAIGDDHFHGLTRVGLVVQRVQARAGMGC